MRVLIATTNIAAHAAGPLPVAAELVRRGHSVRWYAGAAYDHAIAATGATRVPLTEARDISGANIYATYPELAGLDGVAQIRGAFAKIFIGLAAEEVRDLQAELADHPADVLLVDPLFFAAGLVHELGGLVYATLSDSMLALPSRDTAPFGPGIPPLKGPLGRLRNRLLYLVARRVLFRSLDPVYADVRSRVGLPAATRHVMDTIGSPYLMLQPGVPAFEYARSDLPAHVHFVGAVLPEADPAWQPPSWWGDLEGRSVVHVTQGTVNNQLEDLLLPTLEALADTEHLVVATTGGPTHEDLEARLGRPLPVNVRVAPFIPYRELLARASVFVTNGGYSGVLWALAHGVPIVQAGITEEKKEIASRISYSGVGVALGTSTPSKEQVRRGVEKVLTQPTYAEKARQVRDQLATHDARREVADLLESLVAGRQAGDAGDAAHPVRTGAVT